MDIRNRYVQLLRRERNCLPYQVPHGEPKSPERGYSGAMIFAGASGNAHMAIPKSEGRRVQVSSGYGNKNAAARAEAKRKIDLLNRRAGFTKAKLAPKFEEFAKQFLDGSEQQHRPKTYELQGLNCETLKRFFRGKYLDEITGESVEDFESARKRERLQWSKKRFVTGATVKRALTTLKLF